MPPETSTGKGPAPGSRLSLSVILPALNEQTSLERAVVRTRDVLERLCHEFEILVINDGSTDRTGEIAERLASENQGIRVLHNERNVNYGESLKRGIAAARCEWVHHNGIDLPLAPEDIERFVPFFESSDVVVASRRDRGAHSPWRQLTSWANNRLLRLLFLPSTRDLNFTQFYRRSFLEGVELVSSSPAFVTPELILRAERAGLRVREVDVEFRRREAGRAHFGKPKDILWTLRDMLRLRLRTWLRGWDR